MGKRKATGTPVTYYGKRVGTKRADRRWQSPDGQLWDSRYEFIVYNTYRTSGYDIQRCDESDTFSFTLPIRGGSCGACGSTKVGQRRHFTPDFRIVSSDKDNTIKRTYIEAKGYLRPKECALLRAFSKENPDSNVSILFQHAYRKSRATAKKPQSSIADWALKYLPGFKVAVWNGEVPHEWQESASNTPSAKRTKRRKRDRSSV